MAILLPPLFFLLCITGQEDSAPEGLHTLNLLTSVSKQKSRKLLSSEFDYSVPSTTPLPPLIGVTLPPTLSLPFPPETPPPTTAPVNGAQPPHCNPYPNPQHRGGVAAPLVAGDGGLAAPPVVAGDGGVAAPPVVVGDGGVAEPPVVAGDGVVAGGGGGTVAAPVWEELWCVAKPSVPSEKLQEAMDYACGEGGADCAPISPAGTCYFPDTTVAHASYAFNSYWQKKKKNGGTCGFGGTAMLINSDPSFLQCHFTLA